MQKKIIQAKPLSAPALLAGYGIAAFYHNHNFYDRFDAHNDLQKNFPNFKTDADGFLPFAPGIAVYTLNICGIQGKHNFTDRTAIYLIANAINGGITLTMKNITHVKRPDKSNSASLPSLHTSVAFANAQFMHCEYGERSLWYSSAAYADATAVAVLRMLNNKHWLSDVMVGAAVGMVSAQITYWIYPAIKKQVILLIKQKRKY
ncbi:MAG: phosphatase PAP2 family protein [Lentimicrobiaceae bacterium]|nr:phosphatase PAP2 family protein [Lentimicrobiaceae bacterium]